MARRDDKRAVGRCREAPDLALVSFERQDVLEAVGVPVLDGAVLARGEEVVRAREERDGHDRVAVREEGLVAVAKVEAPDLRHGTGAGVGGGVEGFYAAAAGAHTLTFLSADPVMRSVESAEMSIVSTGSLWP